MKAREGSGQSEIVIDNESLQLTMIGNVFIIAGEGGQIFRPMANSDWGIDGEIEFKDDRGRASGRRVYLQLKAGDSHLRKRARDGKEVFTIKNERHIDYWQKHAYPVMLVIRTSNGLMRWMNVTEYLRKRGSKARQIVFDGEPFTVGNLLMMRERQLSR